MILITEVSPTSFVFNKGNNTSRFQCEESSKKAENDEFQKILEEILRQHKATQ